MKPERSFVRGRDGYLSLTLPGIFLPTGLLKTSESSCILFFAFSICTDMKKTENTFITGWGYDALQFDTRHGILHPDSQGQPDSGPRLVFELWVRHHSAYSEIDKYFFQLCHYELPVVPEASYWCTCLKKACLCFCIYI